MITALVVGAVAAVLIVGLCQVVHEHVRTSRRVDRICQEPSPAAILGDRSDARDGNETDKNDETT
jgi:hypothetical protein